MKTRVSEPRSPGNGIPDQERGRLKITALKAVELREWGGQALVKVDTDAGVFGVGEAGTSGPIARAHLRALERILIGQDPLDIELLFDRMADSMHPHRANIPTVSGVDIALWDLAGKVLGRPVSGLLSGRLRNEIPIYYTGGPENPLDPGACRRWADAVKALADGYRTFKCDFTPCMTGGQARFQVAQVSQMLDRRDLDSIRQGFENIREALGDSADIIVHCHNELHLSAAIGLVQAVAGMRPIWVEDALPVWYSEAWKSLHQASPVPLATGEKLEMAREFLPFLTNGALDAIHPDLCFAGGITGGRRIAELAELFYLPVVTHNVGSTIQNMACAHFGASVRNFVMSETRIYVNPMVRAMVQEELVTVGGKLAVPEGPGLGITIIAEMVNANRAPGEPLWE